MNTYTANKQTSTGVTDTNFCTVMSASIALNLDFEYVHQVFKNNGRKNRKGVPWDTFFKIVKGLAKKHNKKIEVFKPNWDKEDLDMVSRSMHRYYNNTPLTNINGKVLTNFTSLTINNFRDHLPSGNYIFGCNRHAVGVYQNTVQDWTALEDFNGKQKRNGNKNIRFLIKVTDSKEKIESLEDLLNSFES